jgi:three-Cys-motif partner protein
MKAKWDVRVYVELYAGAGYNRIRGTESIIPGSPIRALTVKDPFDKYIFCEGDAELLEALKARVKRTAPSSDVSFIPGDCNLQADKICSEIPPGSSERKVLSLCFVDPFDIGIKFGTLRILSKRYVDFLILLAVYMDANRAYAHYVDTKSTKVDEFLGSQTWRDRWTVAQSEGVPFPGFLAREFASNMGTLGYLPTPIYSMKKVRSDEKNLPLYYVALFSRNQLAYQFWEQVLEYSTDQRSLGF